MTHSTTERRGRWGRRAATLTAFVGLAAAAIPLLSALGVRLPGVASEADRGSFPQAPVQQPDGGRPTTTHPPPATATTSSAATIRFTVSDRLTEWAEEEIVVVSLEGVRVATLHASRANPVVTQQVRASRAGNYSYVVDADISWIDAAGRVQHRLASGRGSVYIRNGARLDLYNHADGDWISLSLESAT